MREPGLQLKGAWKEESREGVDRDEPKNTNRLRQLTSDLTHISRCFVNKEKLIPPPPNPELSTEAKLGRRWSISTQASDSSSESPSTMLFSSGISPAEYKYGVLSV